VRPRRQRDQCIKVQIAEFSRFTVSVTDAVYRNARVWCARRDASISETVQYILENLSRLPRALRAIHEADEAAAAAKAAAEFAAQPAPETAGEDPISGCETVEAPASHCEMSSLPLQTPSPHRTCETVNL